MFYYFKLGYTTEVNGKEVNVYEFQDVSITPIDGYDLGLEADKVDAEKIKNGYGVILGSKGAVSYIEKPDTDEITQYNKDKTKEEIKSYVEKLIVSKLAGEALGLDVSSIEQEISVMKEQYTNI